MRSFGGAAQQGKKNTRREKKNQRGKNAFFAD
jgi:hypothetical protein